jgi:hypothetical protein
MRSAADDSGNPHTALDRCCEALEDVRETVNSSGSAAFAAEIAHLGGRLLDLGPVLQAVRPGQTAQPGLTSALLELTGSLAAFATAGRCCAGQGPFQVLFTAEDVNNRLVDSSLAAADGLASLAAAAASVVLVSAQARLVAPRLSAATPSFAALRKLLETRLLLEETVRKGTKCCWIRQHHRAAIGRRCLTVVHDNPAQPASVHCSAGTQRECAVCETAPDVSPHVQAARARVNGAEDLEALVSQLTRQCSAEQLASDVGFLAAQLSDAQGRGHRTRAFMLSQLHDAVQRCLDTARDRRVEPPQSALPGEAQACDSSASPQMEPEAGSATTAFDTATTAAEKLQALSALCEQLEGPAAVACAARLGPAVPSLLRLLASGAADARAGVLRILSRLVSLDAAAYAEQVGRAVPLFTHMLNMGLDAARQRRASAQLCVLKLSPQRGPAAVAVARATPSPHKRGGADKRGGGVAASPARAARPGPDAEGGAAVSEELCCLALGLLRLLTSSGCEVGFRCM